MQKQKHIPKNIARNKVIHRLVMERAMLLEKFRLYSMRINPYHPQRSVRERERTKRRQVVSKSLDELEPELMYRLGWIVQHPEIYTAPTVDRTRDPLDKKTFSTYDRLRQSWKRYRPPGKEILWRKGYDKNDPKNAVNHRHVLAQQIMDLEWSWLSALHHVVCPNETVPPRRIVHPSRYKL